MKCGASQAQKKPCWIWLVTCKITKKIIAHRVGSRSRKTLLKQWKLKADKYYTDDFISYKEVLPKSKHNIGKQYTQISESKNFQLRHYLSCLRRKSCCYHKSYRTLNASLALITLKINKSFNPNYLTKISLLS